MKYFFALCCFLATSMLFPRLDAAEWLTDFQKAKEESARTGRPIFILFTNSDAAACLSFDRTIFSQKKFLDYADKNLVLMKADFPVAIHRQPKPLSKQNNELRAEFGITVLPTMLLLDSNGKLDASYLPSYVDDIIDLKAITGTAPTTCAVGDMYYNSASGNLKIYTATAANTWGTTGATPEVGKIYVNLADSKIYRWSGSAMVEISKQVSTVTSVRATSSALDTVVPTEKAVATALAGKAASSHSHSIANVTGLQDALDAKQGTLTAGTNISISNGTVSNTYS